MATAPSGRS
uniref:Uncharacterized protein n=1 Tax=Arundo donax TaxID=35708 RepID=A0A0A8ZRB8_ARUDO